MIEHFKRVQFGIVPPNSSLSFAIKDAEGFAVHAVLDCDTKVVASWEWEEIKGGVSIEETLIPKGTYSLTLQIVFTGQRDSTVEAVFSVNDTKKVRSIVGKRPDRGRMLAVLFVQ